MIITAVIKSYFLVIVALTSVAGSAIAVPYISNLANVSSNGSSSPTDSSSFMHEAAAQKAPYKVDHHLKINEKAGDPLRIVDNINDGEQHCEMTCKYIEYQPGGQGKAALAFVSSTPVDLSGAKKVTFFLMGENGGEKVKVKIAGKNPGAGVKGDELLKEKFELSSGDITLPNDWQRYEVPLDGVDLKNVKAPFGMDVLKGQGSAKQVVYLKYIVYEDAPVDQRFLLTANATANTTATANATALATTPNANATGNATAANDRAPQDNNNTNNNIRGQSNENARGVNGRGNSNNTNIPTTGDATEADNNDSVNETTTSTNNTSPGISEEQIDNDTNNTPVELQDNENLAPIAMSTVDRLVAHPSDRVILDGSLSSDPDGEVITYQWSQSDGPEAEIIAADTATPTVTIPTLDQNDQITIDLVVSDGQSESSKASVIIDVQYVEDIESATQQDLLPADDTIQGEAWSDTECGGNNAVIVECLTDSSDSTFVSSDSPSGTADMMFSFQDVSSVGINNSNQIVYVTAQVTAKKTGASGFTSIIVDDPNNSEHYSIPGISISSDSFEQYTFTWNNNPITGERWTADSLNSIVAGYRHIAGQGSVEISEFKLIIGSLVTQVEQEPLPPPPPASTIDEESAVAEDEEEEVVDDDDNDDGSNQDDSADESSTDTTPEEVESAVANDDLGTDAGESTEEDE